MRDMIPSLCRRGGERVKVEIEAEPKEIAALIFAVSERQIDETVEAAIQREAEKFAKVLKKENERFDSIFHTQVERLRQS